MLEYTVNVNIDDIPRALSFTIFDIPAGNVIELKAEDLPGNWTDAPAPRSTRDFGTALLKKGEYGVIKIPSAVIPDEFNYLVNPLHSDITACKIVDVSDFVYDVRIKMV